MTRAHPIHRITDFSIVAPFQVSLTFDDGAHRVVDFSDVLEGELYEPLKDENFFRQVTLDPVASTLVWPNGADFDPATLHDWPSCADEFRAMASRWREARSRSPV